jgi:hypothetical protein
MPKRILRVVKWIGTTPAVGMCAACECQFTLPVASLKNVVEARAKMQALFDVHQCGQDIEAAPKSDRSGDEPQ